MKKKTNIVIAVICVTGFILGTTALAQAATAKPTAVGFANMAASVEKSYGTVLELDLEIRNNKPVYKADVIANGKMTRVYFNAVTGAEIERKNAVALDEDEARIYNGYIIASPVSAQEKNTAVVAAAAQNPPTPSQAPSPSATSQIISYDKAKETAIAKAGGGVVREIDLDHKHGKTVYEVEVKHNGHEYEIDIDAATGEVIKHRMDD